MGFVELKRCLPAVIQLLRKPRLSELTLKLIMFKKDKSFRSSYVEISILVLSSVYFIEFEACKVYLKNKDPCAHVCVCVIYVVLKVFSH